MVSPITYKTVSMMSNATNARRMIKSVSSDKVTTEGPFAAAICTRALDSLLRQDLIFSITQLGRVLHFKPESTDQFDEIMVSWTEQ